MIKDSEHVFIAGRTGSGKTFLEKAYLAGFKNVIILDTKGTFYWEQIPDALLFTNLEDLIQNYKEGKAIYRPIYNELNDYYYNKFFEYCYYRGNIIIGVDEVMSVAPNSAKLPEFYKAILTRGRELKVALWSCTQRPKTIPLQIISESTHFFVFDLNILNDRKRMVEVTGMPEFLERPSNLGGEHAFWYYNFKMDEPILAQLE